MKQEDLNFSVVSPSLPVDKRPQEDDYDDYDMPLVAIKRVPSKLGGSIKISISKSSLGDVSTEDSKSTVIGSGVGLDTPPSSTNYEADFGFYKGAIAEVISSRYRTVAKIGKGVFSTVFRCIDMNTTNEVAVKVLRNKENSSSNTDAILLAKEVRIVQALQRVPTKATGIIQIFDTFEHSGHRCFSMEPMRMNIREYYKSLNNGGKSRIGLSILQLKLFSKQLFQALEHVHKCGYIHADIKPDNILIDSSCTIVKLCDFGATLTQHELQAMNTSEAYIVARYYRAPEIILDYDQKSSAIDIWAMGVTVLELFRGSLVFKGSSNTEVLWEIMNLLGPIPKKTLKDCRRKELFKEEDGTLYFEKHIIESSSDPSPSPSGGGTAACENHVGFSATKVTSRTWVEIPLQDTNHQKILESIFQAPLATMQRVSSSGFDCLVLSALRLDPLKRSSASDLLHFCFSTKTTQKATSLNLHA